MALYAVARFLNRARKSGDRREPEAILADVVSASDARRLCAALAAWPQ